MNSWEARHGNKPIPMGVKRKMVYAGQYYLPDAMLAEIADEDGNASVPQIIELVDQFGEWL